MCQQNKGLAGWLAASSVFFGQFLFYLAKVVMISRKIQSDLAKKRKRK